VRKPLLLSSTEKSSGKMLLRQSQFHQASETTWIDLAFDWWAMSHCGNKSNIDAYIFILALSFVSFLHSENEHEKPREI
jgi:hypothetical protein